MRMRKSTIGYGAFIAIVLLALAAIFMTNAPYLRGFWEGLLIGFLLTLFFGILIVSLNRFMRRERVSTRTQAR